MFEKPAKAKVEGKSFERNFLDESNDTRVDNFLNILNSSEIDSLEPLLSNNDVDDKYLYLKKLSALLSPSELVVFAALDRIVSYPASSVWNEIRMKILHNNFINDVLHNEDERESLISLIVRLADINPKSALSVLYNLRSFISDNADLFKGEEHSILLSDLASRIRNFFLAGVCLLPEPDDNENFDFRKKFYDRNRNNAYIVWDKNHSKTLNHKLEGNELILQGPVLSKISNEYSAVYTKDLSINGFFKNDEEIEKKIKQSNENHFFPESSLNLLYDFKNNLKIFQFFITKTGSIIPKQVDVLIENLYAISPLLPEELANQANNLINECKLNSDELSDQSHKSHLLEEAAHVLLLLSDHILNLEQTKKPVTLLQIKEVLDEMNFPDVDNVAPEAYLTLLQPQFRSQIESEFKIRLESLPIRVQFQFLRLIFNGDKEYIAKVINFIDRAGDDENARLDRFKSFLSLERGDETLGDSIIAFGQHDEVAGTVFHYYSELLSSADRAEELVREVSACEGEACVEFANQVRENILNRAQKDLEKAVRAHDSSEVAAQIENYVASAKEYVALLQEVGAGNIESVSPEALSAEDRTRMQNLLQANYRTSYPDLNDTKFRDAVANSLATSFKNPNTTFRILRDQGKIVSYNRFDILRDYTGKEVSYFGSFNADPAYSGVGGVMLEETIKDRLEDGRPMMAYSDPSQPITKKYIEEGFVVTELHPFGGKNLFEIWRSKDSVDYFESKTKSITELLSFIGSAAVVVREQSDTETYPELQSGMALTRYFNHQGKTFVVFEKLPETLRDWFTPPQEEFKKAA